MPARRDEHGVLPAVQGRRPRAAGVVDDLELHVVDVEAVRVPRLVADLPDLGAAGGHGLVDAAHVHLPAVDGAEAVEREGARPADGTRVEPLVADEPLRDRRRRRQRRRGAHLQQVEAVVTAGEAVLERVGTKVWREAAQNGPLARPEGGDHLGALAGRQGHAGDAPWRVEQAAVAADQVEGAAVPEADLEGAGGRGVEQPEAHALAGHVQMGVVGAVDQGGAAEPADRVERPVGEVEPALAVEVLVLDDQGDVVDAVALGQRQRARLGVVEQEHPGDAPVDVVLGAAVRVRVVPEGRGGLVDRPARRPGGAGGDHVVRAAVGPRRQVHPVPVDGGRLRQAVGDVDGHPVAAAGAQGRAEVGAVGAPRRGGPAGQQLTRSRLQPQVEDLAPAGVRARGEQRRDLQAVGEAELADGAGVGARVHRGRQADQAQHQEHDQRDHSGQQDQQQPAGTPGRAGTGRHGCGSCRHHAPRVAERPGWGPSGSTLDLP